MSLKLLKHFLFLTGEMYVIMKNAGVTSQEVKSKGQLEKDIENAKSKLSKTETDFTNEKNRLQSEIAKLKDMNGKLETEKKAIVDKCKTMETDSNNVINECKSLKEEKKNLESQIAKLHSDISKTILNYTTLCILLFYNVYSDNIFDSNDL